MHDTLSKLPVNGNGNGHALGADRPFVFDALNALVDSGWLEHLSAIEQAVILVHLRHSNGDGVSWPSLRRIGKILGHSQTRHVRAARARLVALGFLTDAGGWANGRDAIHFKLSIPPLPDYGRGQKRPGPNQSKTPPRFRDTPLPDSAKDPSPNRDGVTTQLEQHNGNSINHADDAAESALFRTLERVGVTGGNLHKFAKEFAEKGIIPEIVTEMYMQVGGTAQNRTGVLISNLRADGARRSREYKPRQSVREPFIKHSQSERDTEKCELEIKRAADRMTAPSFAKVSSHTIPSEIISSRDGKLWGLALKRIANLAHIPAERINPASIRRPDQSVVEFLAKEQLIDQSSGSPAKQLEGAAA